MSLRNRATTKRVGCFSTDGAPMFSVNPGLSAVAALELASCFLATISGLSGTIGEEGGDTSEAYAAHYLADMAKALVDSATEGLLKAGQSQ